MAVKVANLRLASEELGIVEKDCKGMIKRIVREIRAGSDREGRKRIGSKRDRENEAVGGTATGARTGYERGTAIINADEGGSCSSMNGAGLASGYGSGSGSGSTIKGVKRDLDRNGGDNGIGSELFSSSTSPSTFTTSNPPHLDPKLSLTTITESTTSKLDTDVTLKAFSTSSASSTSTTTPSPHLPVETVTDTPSDSKPAKHQFRQGVITKLRVEALRLLGQIAESQGRPERRGRWDSLTS